MSCVESCSTDSGEEKPATVSIRVAPGAAGGGGTTRAVSTAAAVSATLEARFRSTGWHAVATARVVQRTVALIRALPPPRPRLRCVARRARESPPRHGLRATANNAVGTYPRGRPCALRGVCGRLAAA